MGYAELAEAPTEPPVLPPNVPWPDPPNSELGYHHGAGHAHGAGYDVIHCLKLRATQDVDYSSDWGVELNESARDCMSKPPAGLPLSEEVPQPSGLQMPWETRLVLEEPPSMTPQQSCYPEG